MDRHVIMSNGPGRDSTAYIIPNAKLPSIGKVGKNLKRDAEPMLTFPFPFPSSIDAATRCNLGVYASRYLTRCIH